MHKMVNYVIVLAAFVVALICHSYGDLVAQETEAIQKVEYRSLLIQNDIDDAIIAALENLRAEMPTGNPELGIPPLDPMFLDHYELDMNIELFTMNLTLYNTTVTKLSEFVVNKIENDLENLSANFNVTLPDIDFAGQYDAVGALQGFLNITGNGNYTLSLQNLTTWGTVKLGSESGSDDGMVSIQSLELDFNVGALQTDFENLTGGGITADVLNTLISTSGPDYLNDMKPTINEYIASLVIDIANPILSHYTLNQILEFLGINPN